MIVRYLAVATVLGLATTANAAEFVKNGTFAAGGANWATYNGDSIEVLPSGIYGQACVNAACVNDEINANTYGDLYQTVTGLTVGRAYTLSWLYGGRPSAGFQQADVSFGGAFVASNSATDLAPWVSNSYTVVAKATTEVLRFKAVATSGQPSYGNELTNVSLTGAAVPEPASWALMVVGLGCVGAGLRRRKTVAAA